MLGLVAHFIPIALAVLGSLVWVWRDGYRTGQETLLGLRPLRARRRWRRPW